MIFLVMEAAPEIRESLCRALLSFGIKGVPVAGRSQALEEIRNNPDIQGLLIDIDSREVEGMELIQDLQSAESKRGLKIIVHTIRANREAVTRMVELGVLGYILKPYKEEEIFAKLQKTLAKLEGHVAQRKHIRVKPDPEELLRLNFRLTGRSGLVSGKILDISMGGVAAELLNLNEEEGLLEPGTPIESVQFSLSGIQLNPSAKVVLIKGRLLALHFESMNPEERSALSRYIFKRISI